MLRFIIEELVEVCGPILFFGIMFLIFAAIGFIVDRIEKIMELAHKNEKPVPQTLPKNVIYVNLDDLEDYNPFLRIDEQ